MKLDHPKNIQVFVELLNEYLKKGTLKETCDKYKIPIAKGEYMLFEMYMGLRVHITDRFGKDRTGSHYSG